jgi:hypothetical protein
VSAAHAFIVDTQYDQKQHPLIMQKKSIAAAEASKVLMDLIESASSYRDRT